MNVALRPEPGPSCNLISLCTGGGGLDLGVELAMPGARVVCMVEREAFAVAHLVEAMREGLLGQAPIWSDARTFAGRPWRGLVDGVIGGIPCQPHSHAGRRGGASDERDLWAPRGARRIIVQSGAWWVLIENVPGMLTARDGETPGAERVRRDLQRLGFLVEGGLFEAPEVGGTDERQRLFILGVADAQRLRCGARDQRDLGAETAGGRAFAASSDFEMANTWRTDQQRRGGSAELLRQAGPAQGRGHQRERGGDTFGHSGSGLADAGSARLPLAEQPGQPGQTERGVKSRSTASELRGAHVADADGGGGLGRPDEPEWGAQGRAVVDRPDGLPLWPPRPNDLDGWREALDIWPAAQPAVRGMAHGLAGRVDPLRLLGNGVKPLQAAYALRTLATRLAARGSASAALLVRMMAA